MIYYNIIMFQENIKIQKLLYDYYNTPIYLNHFEKNTIMNGFIKLPFINANSLKEPNLYTSNNNYKIQNLYIFKNIHNINNIDYDGELVIEHIPITNNEDKVYTVLLLKTTSGSLDNNDIDTIIYNAGINNPKKKVNLNLNNILSQTMINSDTKNNNYTLQHKNVFVFIKPIYVNSHFINFSDDILNSPFPKYKKYEIVVISEPYYTNNISFKSIFGGQDNIKEGMSFKLKDGDEEITSEDVYVDCRPIDDSDVDKNVQYVPITSDNKNNGLNIFTIGILSIIVVIFTFYPISLIYKILFNILNIKGYTSGSINTIINFVILVFLTIGIYVLVMFEYSNITLLSGGFIILIALIFIFVVSFYNFIGTYVTNSTGINSEFNVYTVFDFLKTILYYDFKNLEGNRLYYKLLKASGAFLLLYGVNVIFFQVIYSAAINEINRDKTLYSINNIMHNPYNFMEISLITTISLMLIYLVFTTNVLFGDKNYTICNNVVPGSKLSETG